MLKKLVLAFIVVSGVYIFVVEQAVRSEITENKSQASEIKVLLERADSCYYYCRRDSLKVYAELALAKAKNRFGESDSLYALALTYTGLYYSQSAKYAVAESLLLRALEIQESTLPEYHPDIAVTIRGLGLLYWINGRYVDAEPALKRALNICQRFYGNEHVKVADNLINLAIVHAFKGDKEAGEECFEKARLISEKVIDNKLHPEIARIKAMQAYMCSYVRQYTAAESLYNAAIDIFRQTIGTDHLWVGICFHNSGAIKRNQGDFAAAESLVVLARKSYLNAMGPDFPWIGNTYRMQGNIASARGKYAEAEEYLKKSLEIYEKSFGHDHAETVFLADLYGAMEKYDQATKYYIRDWKRRRNYIDYVFSYASEKQKFRYIRNFPLIDDSHLTLSIAYDDPQIKESALEMILKSKAIVLDASAAEKEFAFCSYDPDIKLIVDNHAEICGEIATITLAASGAISPPAYFVHLNQLYNQKESLETELSRYCQEFDDDLTRKKFSVEDVAKALPEDAVLVEYAHYSPFDFKKHDIYFRRFGPRRYMAFTLDHNGSISITDIGERSYVDSLIAECREKIYLAPQYIYSENEKEAESDLVGTTGKLYEILFAPLERYFSDKKQIFVSPDGQLNLLPFDILYCSDGEYLIEKYQISYLSSGKDLLKRAIPAIRSEWALTLSNPDFNSSGDIPEPEKSGMIASMGNAQYSDFIYRGVSPCLDQVFSPLPHAELETRLVVKTLEEASHLKIKSLYNSEVIEGVLKTMESPPRILHLATHGFFCETENELIENPLLRSGLVLSGANNLRKDSDDKGLPREDGILTAFEVSALNLVGTELVTLSACESGIGEVRNGEGVFGLRRAFQIAGAETIIMSLWSVPDRETRELMEGFYKNWLHGELKTEALRKSALKILYERRQSKGAAHPIFWGGFALLGNPD